MPPVLPYTFGKYTYVCHLCNLNILRHPIYSCNSFAVLFNLKGKCISRTNVASIRSVVKSPQVLRRKVSSECQYIFLCIERGSIMQFSINKQNNEDQTFWPKMVILVILIAYFLGKERYVPYIME